MMPKPGFRSFTIQECMYARLRGHYMRHREYYRRRGVTTLTGMIVRLLSEQKPSGRFAHTETYDSGVRIHDRWTGTYYRVRRDWTCTCDRGRDCMHVGFAMSLLETSSWET